MVEFIVLIAALLTLLFLIWIVQDLSDSENGFSKRNNAVKFRDLLRYSYFIVVGRSGKIFYKNSEGIVDKTYAGDDYDIWNDTVVQKVYGNQLR